MVAIVSVVSVVYSSFINKVRRFDLNGCLLSIEIFSLKIWFF